MHTVAKAVSSYCVFNVYVIREDDGDGFIVTVTVAVIYEPLKATCTLALSLMIVQTNEYLAATLLD